MPLEGPDSAVVAVRASEAAAIETLLDVPSALVAPVLRGQKVGDLVYRADGREVARFALTAAADVAPAGLLKRAWDTVRMTIERLCGPGA